MILTEDKYSGKSFVGLILIFFFQLFTCLPAYSEGLASLRVAVLVSQNIKPYYEAVEGLSEGLKSLASADIEIIYFESHDKNPKELKDRITSGKFDTVVAVGPQASVFVNSLDSKSFFSVYIMVLDPENIFSAGTSACGISLNIPVSEQIKSISRQFPKLRKIGIPFDPKKNSIFIKKAVAEARQLNVDVVELPVVSTSEIVNVLSSNMHKIDLLWLIPDSTVISESLTPFIIRKTLERSIPCVGYNRFFLSSGAAMAFIIDYKKIGIQASELIVKNNKFLNEKPCALMPPEYEVVVNDKILSVLKHQKDD